MQVGGGDLFDHAEIALDAARGRDLGGLFDGELHEAFLRVDRLRRKAEAESVRLLGEIDLRRSHEPVGAKTAGVFAAWKLPVADDYARGLARCARQLRGMALVQVAFWDASISTDHVGVLARCQATNPDAFNEAEGMLIGLATSMDYVEFTKVAAYWCQIADPDGSQDDAEKRLARRRARAVVAPDGMVLVDAQLDPVGGAVFLETFKMICRELFLTDWEAAKALHGEDVSF